MLEFAAVIVIAVVVSLMSLGITSQVTKNREMKRLRCETGHVLIEHKRQFYCTPGYRP